MAEPKQELTTLDLCKMFGVSRTSIFNWRKDKKNKDGKLTRKGLPYYKLGGNGLSDPTRYSLTAVRQFAEETSRPIVLEIYKR